MALQLRQNLNMRMEQKLKLTPQMIQSIEILLLPQMALEERIMQEIETNPALDITEAGSGVPSEEDEAPRGERSLTGPTDGEKFDRAQEERQRIDEYDGDDQLWKRRSSGGFDEDSPDKMAAIAATAERPQSLADYLLDQLRFAELDADARVCVGDICWQLDRRGYLTVELDELFEAGQLEAAERAWEAVRACEPAGIGARDLADCLLLQLQREPGDNSFEMTLVRDHLDDLLRNRLPAIAQQMEVDVQRVQEGLEVIGQLDPQPGLAYAFVENQYVIPDVVCERDAEGEWSVSIPDSHLPTVEVSKDYSHLLETDAIDPREKAYLKEQIGNAKFLIDAVAQRKRTLLKIATEIVKHQQTFLEQGPEQLRPLMRQDIANTIGMHVATVSRAVKEKYIQTPSGVLPLATFFSGGIASQDGTEGESSRSVHLRIKKLIEEENKSKPLSDQAIADLLAKEGLDISRRTVTKYRIADGIPSTRQRRVFAS